MSLFTTNWSMSNFMTLWHNDYATRTFGYKDELAHSPPSTHCKFIPQLRKRPA